MTGQVLRVTWTKGNAPSDRLLQEIRQYKAEVLAYANQVTLKLPCSFAKTLATLSIRNKPAGVSQKNWHKILLSIPKLLSGDPSWLYEMVAQDWTVADIFGCHPISPENRYDYMGFLLLLHGKTIVDVSRDCIVSKTRYGATLTYRRLLPHSDQTTLDLLPDEDSVDQ